MCSRKLLCIWVRGGTGCYHVRQVTNRYSHFTSAPKKQFLKEELVLTCRKTQCVTQKHSYYQFSNLSTWHYLISLSVPSPQPIGKQEQEAVFSLLHIYPPCQKQCGKHIGHQLKCWMDDKDVCLDEHDNLWNVLPGKTVQKHLLLNREYAFLQQQNIVMKYSNIVI